MTPLVTIGIPCYNSARWLTAAIQSAIAQTHTACEIIVVDDGSTDDSPAVAQSFGPKVRLIAGEHRGANHARNLVLANASGEWIQYLDADDYLEPTKILRQLSESGFGAAADVIYSPVLIETTSSANTARETSETQPEHDLFSQWLAWRIPQTGGCLWRREALARIGGWKEAQPCCQEHELYLRALKAGLRFVFAPSPGAVYRIWSEETLCRRDPRLVVQVKTELLDDLHAWMKQRDLWRSEHARTAGRACLEMARTIAKYDVAEAIAYHRERQARGLIYLDGPAAPAVYRLTYRLLGFAAAERLAIAQRHVRWFGR